MHWLFDLLYGPAVLFHELAGDIAYGSSWKGRRLSLLAEIQSASRVIDVGCGEGILVRAAERRGIAVTGFEPSRSMQARARRFGTSVVDGRADALPMPAGSVDLIIASYPGPWIFSDATWQEFGRVLRTDGRVSVLIGGTINRGPRWNPRGVLLNIVGGSHVGIPPPNRIISRSGFDMRWDMREDEWGIAVYLTAHRRDSGQSEEDCSGATDC